MQEMIVHNFEEFEKLVFKDCWDEKTRRYRNNMVYRGVPDKSFDLSSKLNRICYHDLTLEDSVIRSFKKYGYADVKDCTSFWQLLALGQHYGLPTRLLDWTYSPMVAAHFATEDIERFIKDGAVYCMDMGESIKTLPKVLSDELKKARSECFTMAMLDRHAKDLTELEALSADPFFIFYEPASQSNRMANQYALFSLCSRSDKNLPDLIKEDAKGLYKIIIPHEVKLEIRDKLDYMNISERLIYPGLDGVCAWITRHYADLGHMKK